MIEIKPTTRPVLAMSFCSTRFVAYARALGGVEMGSTIALDEAMATPMSTVEVPPIAPSVSCIAEHTTTRIGISKAAVAELEMKLESR